jgi:hypothetical protein
MVFACPLADFLTVLPASSGTLFLFLVVDERTASVSALEKRYILLWIFAV